MDKSPDVEVAEEADISLNPSLADSQSTFGDGRYRDFDDEKFDNENDASEDRFEDDEEPRLKYDRLSSDLKDILATDSATALAVHEKFIVVGTQKGKLYLLDALGHALPQNQTQFGRHSHSVAVSQISIDHSGEYVASCSTDGKVIITGLYSNENNHHFSINRPVFSVTLDPIFAKSGSGRRFMIGDDDRVIMYEKTGFLNRYKQTVLSDGTDGPIKLIRWRGRFAAWWSKKGVLVYDVVQEKIISIIKLGPILQESETEREKMICRIAWSNQTSLFVSFGDTLRICNVRRRDPNEARARDLPHYMVEILHTIPLEIYWISGLAPMDNLVVLLTTPKIYAKADESTEEEEADDDKPQLMIVEPFEDDYNVVSTDYLCFKDHEKHSVHDLHLEYLLQDKYYFIVSPNDIFFGKPRDEDDHVEWLITQQEFEKALTYTETHVKQLRKFSLFSVGRHYVNHLIETCEFDSAAGLLPRVFRGEKRLWQEEILRFIRLNQVASIGPHVPLGRSKNQIKLDSTVYEAVLMGFLKLEPRRDEVFLDLVREWPPELYDVSRIVDNVLNQLLVMPDNQTLQRILATLFSQQKKYDKAMAMYLKLGHKDVFQLIRKHDLFHVIDDKIINLMDLDKKEALKLFLEHSDKLAPDTIVEKLQQSSRNLYFYLDTLCQKDWETSKKFHGYLVGLYADYDPDKLLPFLKASDHYPIQRALETCNNHVRTTELVDERIFILARMSNTREALRLITSEKYDIHKAVEFCKEYDDVDLWHDLIDFSINKPYFVHVLLHNIGTHVDPRILVERIENGREIPGLRDSLVQIMQDYRLQVTLQEGCNKILVSDCFTLLQRQFRNLSRGQSVQKETKCGGCGGRIVSQEASSYCDTFVFNCRHAFHIECLADDASDKGTKCALCDSTNKK